MKSNNVIEINGNLYDAKSGQPLASSEKKTPVKPQAARSVDGFSRSTKIAVSSGATKQLSRPVTTQNASQATAKQSVSRGPVTEMKRSVDRSTTLHRSTVSQPATAATEPTEATPAKTTSDLSSTAFKHADQSRLKRAQQVEKSSAIAKFNIVAPQTIASTQSTPSSTPQPLTNHLAKTHDEALRPAEGNKQSVKEYLIKKAVSEAVSTTTKKQKKSHRGSRIGRYATSGLVVFVLAAYVAYLNVPSISMKVAAHQAGFAATMPGYKPAGYSLKGPIAHSPGQVTVNFHSNTDNRAFSLKQQPTTWDSTALLENYVTKKNPSYLTYQDRGLTIYIYDGSSASWVNGGKLYNLEGKDAQLDTDQLLKLATSV